MAENQARKELVNEFKELNKLGDFSAWEDLVMSNRIYGNGYHFHIGSGVKAVFCHAFLTAGENKWQIPVDTTVEFCKQHDMSLAKFFKTGTILREGNTFKAMIKDSKGSLGTSPPVLLLQKTAQTDPQQPQGGGFNFKNPTDWLGAIGAITAAGSTVVQAMAALKTEPKEDRSIQDIASLIGALNTGSNNNELLFKFFEMQQEQRKSDTKRFEDLIEQLHEANARDPYAEMERTEALLDRIQAKSKPVTPPNPPNVGVGGSVWDKGLDLVGKLLDTANQNGTPSTNGQEVEQLNPAVNGHHPAEMEEEQPEEAEYSPEQQLRAGDLQITQSIVNEESPLSVVSDISKLIMWAKESGLVELIPEVVESDYDIQESFKLYIQTRSTNPQYTQELLSTAENFLPLVANFSLKDEYEEADPDFTPVGPDSHPDDGREEVAESV